MSMAERRLPETRDVWPRALFLFGAGLLVFLALSVVLLGLVFDITPIWPRPGRSAHDNQASPALQAEAKADLSAFRRSEDKALAELGWVDSKAGIARIPIGDAMKIVAEQGLPDWSQPSAGNECGLLQGQVPRAPQATRCGSTSPGGGQTP
jgi:hypothetical protein